MNLGYIPFDLGNPDLKPNFMFKHTEKEKFKELKEKRDEIFKELEALNIGKLSKKRQI